MNSLIVLFIISILFAIAFGAVHISIQDMYIACKHFITGNKNNTIEQNVFLQLRLPRVLLCAITGSILAISGALMQGLFRNPIVEPGLIGTSAGAAFGASIIFVLAVNLPIQLKNLTGPLLVPLFAFAGALTATILVYRFAKSQKPVSVIALLLVGVAINAMALAGTGFMSYISRDPQARSITFWNLGSFSGANWWQVLILGIIAAIGFGLSMNYAKKLNMLLLGEEEAMYLGLNPEKLKRNILIINTLMIAVATAFTGVISFVGLIIPHILRLMIGSDNRNLLPACILSGAILLTWADLAARLLLAPAEIPIGIITALIGAPVYIILLKKSKIFITEN